jgi:phosphoenolpyruvate-protein kinase (PTS system EI component)
MIVGVNADELESGPDVVLDGYTGALIVDPDPALRAEYDRRVAEQKKERQQAFCSGSALTASGEPTQVMINVAGLAELRLIDQSRVDGIDLMRTEFLF